MTKSALLLSISLLALSAGALAHEQDGRQISVEPASTSEVRPPASALSVDVWANRADNTYRIGSDITLSLRASRDVSVTVLNVDAAGRTTMLFPNAFAADNRLRANQVYQVPGPNPSFKLRVGGPTGMNVIRVIATTSHVRPMQGEASKRSGPFEVYDESGDEIARHIEAVTAQDKTTWAVAEFPIQVVAEGEEAPSSAAPAAAHEADATAPFGLAAQPSAFGLDLRPMKTSYRSGDSLSLTVTPERDCKLTLLSVDQKHGAAVLYPNRLQSEPLLHAGRTSFLPEAESNLKFTLLGSEGPQRLVALCTEDWSLAETMNALSQPSDRPDYANVTSEAAVTDAIAAQVQAGRKLAYAATTFFITP
jgi:hypothetical protein